ncbi:MAG: C25 family cysteine peptidase [Candidatus Thermoplasmatota archaeon]|nr:C25 family cysteine peptidase [Candidatus Thermoplasmatota archaeon]
MNRQKSITLAILGLIIFSGSIVSSFQPSIQSLELKQRNSYQLLIIAPDVFSEELERLVVHKNSIGMNTVLITLEEILESPETNFGRDDAEKMKYYIKYARETFDISYVLLVGGRKGQTNSWYLPVRYVHMDNGWEHRYISDLYFADIYDEHGLFSTWNKDANCRFGEWTQGEEPIDTYINLYPDVSLGRLPCRSAKEVNDVVDKIISYETNTYQQPWFDKILAIAGDTYLESSNPLWAGYEGEEYANIAIDYMSDYEPTRMFLSENGFTGSSEVINAINQGYGFIYFVGHGNPRTWGTHPPNEPEFVRGLQNHEMNRLSNNAKYFVCVVSGCHNCQFDVHILNLVKDFFEDGFSFFSIPGGKVWRYEWVPESWGWKITRLKDKGSVVTFGTTALGHTKEDKTSFMGGINELEVELFNQIGVNNVTYAGDVLKETITWYLDTYPIDWDENNMNILNDYWIDVQVVQSYVLFGDPTLKIGGYPNYV